MGGRCSKDQDGVNYSGSAARGPAPSRPLVALGMGALQPLSLKNDIQIHSGNKNTLALHCAPRGENTGTALLEFPLVPPFKDGERRNLKANDAEICVQFSAGGKPSTKAPSAPSRLGFVLLVGAVLCYGWQLGISGTDWSSAPFLAQLAGAVLFVAAWLVSSKQAASTGAAPSSSSTSVRVIGANGKSLQLESKPVVPPVSASGLWTVGDGCGGRFRDGIQQRLSHAQKMLMAKDGEAGWHIDKTDRGLDYYTRDGTGDGLIEFKGQMEIKCAPNDVLFYIVDSAQRRFYDDDFNSKEFNIVEQIDSHTLLCNVGFVMPGPFLSNRAFVTVNYVAMDPKNKSLIYQMFSTDNKADLALAKPNPKSVLADVHAAYLIVPTSGGCKVTFWSEANPKLTGGSLIANTVSKMKPAQLGKICRLLSSGEEAAQRLVDARNAFVDNWC